MDTASPLKEGGIDASKIDQIAQILKNDDEDFEFEEATVECKIDSYLDRVTKDFDQWKSYEEIVLRVLNFYQRSPQKHPADCDSFAVKYKKAESDTRKRSLFIDLDDFLISVCLY